MQSLQNFHCFMKKHRILHWALVAAFLLAYVSAEGPVILHTIFGHMTAAFFIWPLIKWWRRPSPKRRNLWSITSLILMTGLCAGLLTGVMTDWVSPVFEDVHEAASQIPLLAAGVHAVLALRPKLRKMLKQWDLREIWRYKTSQ